MIFIKKYLGAIAIALFLVGCSSETSEENPGEQESSIVVSSGSAEESSESEPVTENKAVYNLESGKEMAEFFRDYFGLQMELYIDEFEEEQEMYYMYPEIFTVTADPASDTVQQITFFDVDEEEIRDILKIADFPEDPVIQEALSFEGDLNEPLFGDVYSTEYKDDVGLGVHITIKGSGWGEGKPYSLGLLYDKAAFDKYST